MKTRRCLAVLTFAFASLTSACSNTGSMPANDDSDNPDSGPSIASDAGVDSRLKDAGPSQSDQSAIVLAAGVMTPEDFMTYVRVFPEVPTGDVDLGDFREFGNANVYVNQGRVFVEQDGVMQRFDVSEDLALEDGPRFSWTDFGIATANASYTVFISSMRAYTLAPELGVIIVWDPSEMVRTDVIELDYPERPEGMETWANDGYVVGDKVIWNLFSGSFDSLTAYPALTLVIADANNDSQPAFVEDSRCLPGGPSFVADNGDYYVHGAGYFGYFYAYGERPSGTTTCALRVKKGELEFDPDYQLDYEDATGSPINTPWIGLGGDRYVTRVWDPDVALPEFADDFWLGEGLRPRLVDRATGTSKPYADLQDVFDVDGVTRIVDGVSYFAISDKQQEPGGSCDVVELHPDGTRPKFHIEGGYLTTLERLR